MRKALVSWLMVVALLAASVAGWAQSGGYYEGLEDGRADAREDVNGTAQFVGGVALGVFYVVFSALLEGKHPAESRMMAISDRSDEYQRAYRESYTEEWKRARTNNGLLGWGVWVAIVVAVYMAAY